MKTDKILHLVQQKKAMRSGGALPLPKAQTGMPVTTADSLRVYNAQMALNKFYADEARKGRLKLDENRPLSDYEWNARRQETNLLNYKNRSFYRGEIEGRKQRENTGRGSWKDDAYKEYFNLTPEQVKKLEYQGIARTNSGNDNIIYYRDLITPLQNLASPFAVIDTRIKPQRVIGYIPTGSREENQYPGGAVEVYDYDPLAVKPFYLRTPQEQKQWEEKYGKLKVASASSPRLTAARKPETMQLMKSIPSRFESSDIDMQPVGRPVIPTPALPQMYMDMRGEWMMKPAISDPALMNDPRFIQKYGYRKSEKKSGGLAKAQKGIVNQNAYDLWYKYNTPEGRAGIPDLYSDYDYRKYFEDAVTGVNPMGFDEESMHFPDTYKYPWHPSFSDESVYYVNQKETPGLSYQTKQKGGLTKAQNGLPVNNPHLPNTPLATGAAESVMGLIDYFLLPSQLPLKAATALGRGAITLAEILNPLGGFRPSTDMLYRGIGKEGFEDAMESGVLRAAQHNYPAKRSIAEIVNSPKQFDKVYYSPDAEAAMRYGQGYVAAVPKTAADFVNRYKGKGKDWSQLTSRQIPIEEATIFQKYPIVGYKKKFKFQDAGESGLQYVPSGTYGRYYDPETKEYIPEVYLPEVEISASKDLPFQNNKFAPFLASRGMAENSVFDDPIAMGMFGAFRAGKPLVEGLKQFGKNIGSEAASQATYGLSDLTAGVAKGVPIKIDPKKWEDAKGYLRRRQFIKGLQEKNLIGKEFNLDDLNYAARSGDKTNKLTQLALDRYNTGFRRVSGHVPHDGVGASGYRNQYGYNMNIQHYGRPRSEFENMELAGVDFDDPLSIAEYQATHIPMEDYGYRSTGEHPTHEYGFIFRSDVPFHRNDYGDYLFKGLPGTDYSTGTYEDWLRKYYEDIPLHVTKDKYGASQWGWGRNTGEKLTEARRWHRDDPTLVGPRGIKAYEIDKSFPFTGNSTLYTINDLRKYIENYRKQFDTGWRGEYYKGGLTKAQNGLQYIPNGTYGNYYDPNTQQYVPQVYLPDVEISASKSLPFQNGKFAPFLAARGTADYVPLETVFLPGTPVVKGLGKVGNVLLDAVNPLAGMRNLKSSIPDYTPGPAYVEALERLNQTRAKYLDELKKVQESPQVGKSLGDITTDIDALNASIKPKSEATTGDLQNMLDQLRSINANLEQNVPLHRRAFTSSDISEQLARQAQDPGDMPGTGVSDVGEAISMQDRIKNFEDIQRQEGIGLSAKYLGTTPQGARFEFVPEKYMIEAKGLTGKGTTVKPEDFYTTSELQKKIDQLAAYNKAQAQFDEMNPLTGADMVMSALSGDKSRDELFQTLFPNVSIPNFNEKIIPPQYMSELREALQYLPSQYFQDPLNPKRTLKWDLQNRMREDSMPKSLADYLAQKSNTWHKEDPLGYAREMMGVNKTEGLSMDEIRRLAESKQNELTDWYRQRLLQDFGKPFTAGDAVRLGLNPNKMGGLTKSKAREILHDKSVHGHPLTDKQRKFFGAIASGKSYKVRVKKNKQ